MTNSLPPLDMDDVATTSWSSFASSLFFFGWPLLLFVVLYTVGQIARMLWVHAIRAPIAPLSRRYGAGSWAVITGATNHSIGEAFATELAAQHGLSVVLMSRSQPNLDAAKERVLAAVREAAHRKSDDGDGAAPPIPQVKTVVIDFTECGKVSFWEERFMPALAGLDISVLVCNVGINDTEHFEQTTPQGLVDLVNVNLTSQMLAIRYLLPQLIARTTTAPVEPRGEEVRNEPHRHSAVISVSSAVCCQRPLEFIGPYCATKAANDMLSNSLYHEFRGSRVDFLSCRPAYVATQMSKVDLARDERRHSAFVLTPQQCVRGLLRTVGHDVPWTYGALQHVIYAWTYLRLPQSIVTRLRQNRLATKKAKAARQCAAATAAENGAQNQ